MHPKNFPATGIVCILSLAGALHAKTFTGMAGQQCEPGDPVGDSEDWNDPRNWGPLCSPSPPPSSGESAFIPEGFQVFAPSITVGDLVVSGSLRVGGKLYADNVAVDGTLIGSTLACGGLHLTGRLDLDVTVSGGMFWNSGAAKSITILPSGFLRMDSGFTKTLNNHSLLENFGTVTHASGAFFIYDDENIPTISRVVNHGTWAMVAGPTTTVTSSQARRHFYNQGTFTVVANEDAPPPTVRFDGIFHNSGTLNVDFSRFVVLNTLILENGCRVTGPGMVLAGGPAPGQTMAIQAFGNINIGEESGSGTITVAAGGVLNCGTQDVPVTTFHTHGMGKFDWVGGTIAGELDLAENCNTSISGPDDKNLSPSTLNNYGTITWTGTGNIMRGERGKFLNHPSGTFIIDTDADMIASEYAYHFGTVENWGTIRKISGTAGDSTEIRNGTMHSMALLDIQSGTLRMNCAYRIASSANIIGAGKTVWSGGGTLAGDLTVSENGTFELAGGSVGFSENPEGIPSGVLHTVGSGRFLWTGGAIGGTFGISAGAAIHIEEPGIKEVYAFSRLINLGSIYLDGGTLYFSGYNTRGGVIENRGLFKTSGPATLAGGGYIYSRLDNFGTVEIGDPYGQFATDTTHFNLLGDGVMNVDIGGPAPGESGHDRLTQSGDIRGSMGGRLHVRLRNGYAPAPGESFQITSGMAGSFTDITYEGPYAFHAEYTNGGLNLVYDGPGAEPLALWKQAHLAGLEMPDSEDVGDPDQDGVPNLLEYALNRNPRVFDGSALTSHPESGMIGFSFRRPHPSGVVYDFETSIDGTFWDSVARLQAGSSQWIDPRVGGAASVIETGNGTSRDVVLLKNPRQARDTLVRLRANRPG